jgi:hypothetical protein
MQKESQQNQLFSNGLNECIKPSDQSLWTLDESEKLEPHEYCDWQPVDLEKLRSIGAL